MRSAFTNDEAGPPADSNGRRSGEQDNLGSWSSARVLLDSGRPEEASSTEAESISSEHDGEGLADPGLVKYT